jgi:protocatechuate 3,4-dioxygenase beta subunit
MVPKVTTTQTAVLSGQTAAATTTTHTLHAPSALPPSKGDREMDIDQDDLPVGLVLSRRDMLVLLGAGGTAAILAACGPGTASSVLPSAAATSSGASGLATATATATAIVAASALPGCVVRPAETEGPYFVDEKLLRSDIRPDPSDGSIREGAVLKITFATAKVTGNACAPYEGLLVDVWHCDALGVYSDVQGSAGTKFLRGYQVTDANGLATFTTVYPGWYQGRTVHIHFKIRSDAAASSGLEFTSQLFFDDTLTDKVFAAQPYAKKGTRSTRNDGDGIYSGGGDQLLLDVKGDAAAGYTTTFPIGLQVS